MRIWVIYIGQGDAILIQLPERFSPADGGRRELIDVLVDGGPSGKQLLVFLRNRYPEGARIEHVVLTHHDADHINGLTGLLRDDGFAVERIYHNGLASWGRSVLPGNEWPPAKKGVFNKAKERVLGLLEGPGPEFQSKYVISNLSALKTAVSRKNLVGDYLLFATAVTKKTKPIRVTKFERVFTDSSFIEPLPVGSAEPLMKFELIWPRERPREYGNWGESVNGNSTTFRLVYREFSMLFTGDHNEKSEDDLLTSLPPETREKLRSDVLKVPHHGSQHNLKTFFKAVSPVISVASMGGKGFGAQWKHPAPKVISWAGGAHRIYHTYIHERAFDFEKLDDASRAEMIEKTHVLIETDGNWFRVVETDDPRKIPSVQQVKRGNGTRWINAREQPQC